MQESLRDKELRLAPNILALTKNKKYLALHNLIEARVEIYKTKLMQPDNTRESDLVLKGAIDALNSILDYPRLLHEILEAQENREKEQELEEFD